MPGDATLNNSGRAFIRRGEKFYVSGAAPDESAKPLQINEIRAAKLNRA